MIYNHKLSDTSAFVLLLAEGMIHTSKNSKAYLKRLDLDAGKELLAKCNKIWPHYSEVIKNRKKCIFDLALDDIKTKKVLQIVIFGAGMDALSIELLSKAKNITIYEIDIANMSLKNKIIKKINKLDDSIHHIESDLRNPAGVLNLLKKRGWNEHKPSVFVFEGISYYLDQKDLFNLFSLFKSKTQHNSIILEYLLTQEHISKKRSSIPAKIFDEIKNESQIRITRYDKNKIQRHLDGIGGDILRDYNLKDMEKNRCKNNTYFTTADSGWINVCHIVI